MNEIILLGNAGDEAKISYNDDGTIKFGYFSLAVKGYEDKTDWFNIKGFKNSAIPFKYISKGSKILIKGRVNFEEYADKQTGETKKSISIISYSCNVLTKFKEGEQQQTQNSHDDIPF